MRLPDTVLLIAIIAVAAIMSGRAQQPVFRASADVVQIDVSVLDRDRQPVHGLTAADFTVVEGGVEQPIVAFAAVDLPDHEPTGAPWIRDVASDIATNQLGAQRVVLVLFDDCSTPWNPSVLQLSRRIAKAAVDELGPQDLASVIYTSARRNGQELTKRPRATDGSGRALLAKFAKREPGTWAVLSQPSDGRPRLSRRQHCPDPKRHLPFWYGRESAGPGAAECG